jgi:hypothetical protein
VETRRIIFLRRQLEDPDDDKVMPASRIYGGEENGYMDKAG